MHIYIKLQIVMRYWLDWAEMLCENINFYGSLFFRSWRNFNLLKFKIGATVYDFTWYTSFYTDNTASQDKQLLPLESICSLSRNFILFKAWKKSQIQNPPYVLSIKLLIFGCSIFVHEGAPCTLYVPRWDNVAYNACHRYYTMPCNVCDLQQGSTRPPSRRR